MDNASPFERLIEMREAAIPSIFFDRGTYAHVGYKMNDWYLEYNPPDPPAEGFRSANLYLRHGGYNFIPSETDRGSGNLYIQLANGDVQSPMHYVTASTPTISRVRFPTDATGGHWANSVLADTKLRFGFYRTLVDGHVSQVNLGQGSISWVSSQIGGALLQAAQWEMLIESEPGDPPDPCEVLLINSELIRRV
jgi:hypothetical protein